MFQDFTHCACLILVLSLSVSATAEERPSNVSAQKDSTELIVGGDSLVQIVDVPQSRDGEPRIVWEWNAQTAEELSQIDRERHFQAIDECKPIEGGQRILVTSSTGGVAILRRDTKAVEFQAIVPMAHSIEMLPRGYVAVAASTHPQGNCLRIFSIDSPKTPVLNLELYSGHGVVFFPKTNELFALGYVDLQLFSVDFNEQDKIQLNLKQSWKLPGKGGHDLAFDDQERRLVVTDEETVWSFDLAQKSFSAFQPLRDQRAVKSISFPSGNSHPAYVKADEQWWSERVRFLSSELELKFPGRRIYKARWIQPASSQN